MNLKKASITMVGFIVKIIFLIIIVMVVYKFSTKAYELGYQVFSEETMAEEPGQDYLITIREDAGTMDIGKVLVEQGLIRSEYVFYVQSLFYEKSGKFLPGEYTLNTSMTSEEILNVLTTEETESETEE